MFEDIDIFNLFQFLFVVGVLIYCVYVSFSMKHITIQLEEEKAYNKYLESNGLNRFELEQEAFENIDFESTEKKEKDVEYFLEQTRNLDCRELDLCTNFIGMYPRNLYAIDRRASLNYLLERYDEAIKDYNYLMRKEPKNFFHVEGCARMYAHTDNLNTALNLINNFYKNKKRDADYFSALGDVFGIVKDYKLSVKNYSEAIKLEPDNEILYMSRAHIYREMGDEEKYQKDTQKYENLRKSKKL